LGLSDRIKMSALDTEDQRATREKFATCFVCGKHEALFKDDDVFLCEAHMDVEDERNPLLSIDDEGEDKRVIYTDIQFRSEQGDRWRHRLRADRAEQMVTDMLDVHRWTGYLIGYEDLHGLKILHRPRWTKGLDDTCLSNMLFRETGKKPGQGKNRRAKASQQQEVIPMGATLTFDLGANEAESKANAEAAVHSYYEGIKAKSKKVLATAETVYNRISAGGKRVVQKDLIAAIRYEIAYEADDEMVVNILREAGYEGLGQRGNKGIARPGTSAASSAPAAPKAPEALKAAEKPAEKNGNKHARA
jgi:hypothetical protein